MDQRTNFFSVTAHSNLFSQIKLICFSSIILYITYKSEHKNCMRNSMRSTRQIDLWNTKISRGKDCNMWKTQLLLKELTHPSINWVSSCMIYAQRWPIFMQMLSVAICVANYLPIYSMIHPAGDSRSKGTNGPIQGSTSRLSDLAVYFWWISRLC